MRRLTLLISIVFTVLVGCQTVSDVEQPIVSIENIDFARGNSFGQHMLITLRLTNPNDFDIAIDGMRATMDVNGQAFAQGVSNYRTVLPRLGSTVIPLEANITLLDLFRQIVNLGRSKTLDYVLYGDVFVADQPFRTVPFEKPGSLDFRP